MTSSASYYPRHGMLHGQATGVMGTRMDVVITGCDEADARRLWHDTLDYTVDTERMISKFIPGSETSLVNSAEPLTVIPISTRFRELLERSTTLSAATEGAWDASMGLQCRFSYDGTGSLIVPAGDLYLDFSSLGKGMVADYFVSHARESSVANAYIDLGGSSISAIGSHPAGDGWQVMVNDPFTGRALYTFTLRDASLSVSGNAPACSNHIVDPRTGLVATQARLSAVMTPSATDAEALSTAWIVADAELRQRISMRFNILDEFVFN